jgi:putative redox protein
MITTHSKDPRYLIEFTDGQHHAAADVGPVKGGQGAGFGPHELMEASLATCINMWIRMQADKLGIPVGPITVSVTLKRDHPQEAFFQYSINLEGPLSPEQRATLMQAADECPVRKTLLKNLSFKRF